MYLDTAINDIDALKRCVRKLWSDIGQLIRWGPVREDGSQSQVPFAGPEEAVFELLDHAGYVSTVTETVDANGLRVGYHVSNDDDTRWFPEPDDQPEEGWAFPLRHECEYWLTPEGARWALS